MEVPGVSGPNAPVARDENGNVIRDKAGFTIPMVFGYDKTTNTELYEFRAEMPFTRILTMMVISMSWISFTWVLLCLRLPVVGD